MKKTLLISLLLFTVPLISAFSSPQQPDAYAEETRLYLNDIGLEDYTILSGPYDQVEFQFSLPAYQEISGDGELVLTLKSVFSSFIAAQGEENYQDNIAGSLEISVNGEPANALILQGEGKEETISVPVSKELLDSPDGSIAIKLFWNGSISCDLNLTTALQILPESFLVLQTADIVPDFSLASFPKPFLSPQSLENSPIYLVIPEPARKADIQAAVILASGFGRLSDDPTSIKLLSPDNVIPSILSNGNLVFIGVKDALSNLPELFENRLNGIDSGEGFIGMTNSPFNQHYALMVISGASSEDMISAAKAAASRKIIPDSSGYISLIETVPQPSSTLEYIEEKSFSEIISEGLFSDSIGSLDKELIISIPAGVQPGVDAYADLNFNYSNLMDYLKSGITIYLNDRPIGSIRFSDSSSQNGRTRIMLPGSLFHPGDNVLRFEFSIFPLNICTHPNEHGLWAQILPDSLIHIPNSGGGLYSRPGPDLNSFASQLNTSDFAINSFIAVQQNFRPSWETAIDYAYWSGMQSKGGANWLELLFLDDINEEILKNRTGAVIALFENLVIPSIADFHFSPPSNIYIGDGTALDLSKINDFGLIQTSSSYTTSDQALLFITGDTETGLINGAAKYFELGNSFQAGSNILFVHGDSAVNFILDEIPQMTPEDDDQTPSKPEAKQFGKPPWILPIAAAAGVGFLMLLGYELSKIAGRWKAL